MKQITELQKISFESRLEWRIFIGNMQNIYIGFLIVQLTKAL